MHPFPHHSHYNPGHPWYYKLGGPALTPMQIRAAAIASGYRGYLASEIAQADQKAEPLRSTLLRTLKAQVWADILRDLHRYRDVLCELAARRRSAGRTDCKTLSSDVHLSMSLKYAHLFNGFAHLHYLNELLALQPDLFG